MPSSNNGGTWAAGGEFTELSVGRVLRSASVEESVGKVFRKERGRVKCRGIMEVLVRVDDNVLPYLSLFLQLTLHLSPLPNVLPRLH